MNKLVKGNLVRGLPSKLFENDQTCVACQKGKQHRAFCKSKTENSISLPLHLLHMDLFGPTFVKSIMKKMYCLVVTYDFSRFTWVFFLATKDETSGILKSFITGIENLVDHKVKVIRYDNGTEFKNREINQFCEKNDTLRQFSVARTPQQNGVAERRNRTLIKDARTMLADSKLPTTFWAEAVNTACYVENRVPFGCPVTILNTINHLGKFDGKADEGFLVGYSLNSKAFRVFNSRTRIVEENLHIRFSENTPNVVGSGPDWLFDIDALTRTMNYEPIVAGTQSNDFAGTKASDNAGQARKKTKPVKNYILLPLWTVDPPYSQDLKISHDDDGSKPSSDDGKKVDEDLRKECESVSNTSLSFYTYLRISDGLRVLSIRIDNCNCVEMAADPNVFVMGEQVGQCQGAFKGMQALLDLIFAVEGSVADAARKLGYGMLGLSGIGVGSAYHGLNPVVEFDFQLLHAGSEKISSDGAIDHIINSATKSNYMSAGQINVPIVFRGPNGPATGVGAQHSQNCLDSVHEELKEEMKVEPKEEMKNELKEEMREELKE
ncbi:putative ribonuclease H-like domain-containing protein [Tanacetum coccineum]